MKKLIKQVATFVLGMLFGQIHLESAVLAQRFGRQASSLQSMRSRLLYFMLAPFFSLGLLKKLQKHIDTPVVAYSTSAKYDKHLLNLMTNRVFDMPSVEVDVDEPIRVNVLVPGFSIESISAGFFGVFNVAKFIALNGFRVRLVLFDNFHYDEASFRASLNQFPSFSNLFDTVEIDYIGERKKPLIISPFDGVVATVWYSAYFAEKIQSLANPKPFLYLIQDYEAAFYPFSSLNKLSDKTYYMHYNALISTTPLMEFMKNGVEWSDSKRKCVSFNNACSSVLPERDVFFTQKLGRKRRFVFYSRPAVNRNMFELSALAVIHAFEEGIFGDGSDWEFYGMGLGEVTVQLSSSISIHQLPRMGLKEYEESIHTFDLCLSLMASPHPSIVPFDLARAGCLVVTNTFETKTAEYFDNISGNIIPSTPDVVSIVSALRQAASRVEDISVRYENAQNIKYPCSWDEVWNEQHAELMFETFRG